MGFIPPPSPPPPPRRIRNIVQCRGCNSPVDASIWGDLCSICVVTGGKSPLVVEENTTSGWQPTSIQVNGWEPTKRPPRPKLEPIHAEVSQSVLAPKAPLTFQEEMDAALAFDPLQELILQRTKSVV
jgi:hypothetical protein